MKKVTIVTSTENESLLLDQLGKARLISFKTVPASEYKDYEEVFEEQIDFKALSKELTSQYKKLIELEPSLAAKPRKPEDEDLKIFAKTPEETVDKLLDNLLEMRTIVKENMLKVENVVEKRDLEIEKLRGELKEKKNELTSATKAQEEALNAEIKQLETELYSLRTRAKSLEVLSPDELKTCSAAGVVKTEVIPELSEFLKTRSKGSFKSYEISPDESLLFFFDIDDDQKLLEFLFLVYEVVDVYESFQSGDLLLVLDPSRKEKRVQEYNSEIKEYEAKIKAVNEKKEKDANIEAAIAKLEKEYEAKIADVKEKNKSLEEEKQKEYEAKVAELKDGWAEDVARIKYYEDYLKNYSKDAPVLRNQVISLMQGWVPSNRMTEFEGIVNNISDQTSEKIFYKVEEADESDGHHIPSARAEMPGFLNNTWILTQLRGWPALGEINPAYISVLVFCFQFGLMFGDIGQGLVYLAIGLAFYKKFSQTRGMMKYLTSMFIPMGIAAIVFGFMYDSIFLYEHQISHYLEHSLHLELSWYPIMPNPTHETGELMNLIFLIGALEIVFGAMLGAANAFKEGNYAGMIGEHGFGMGLYVTGLYLSASHMFTDGLDVMVLISNWPFKLMIAGMLLSFAEPIVHSLMHGHGIGGMEAFGEGIGGLLMTFVEGLANMFSFLRIAAFAIAHVSLAGAGEAMGTAISSPIAGMIIMNVIALSFEFVSSSVQSLRLLYYEFMGKFFHGEGVPFKPFKIRNPKPVQ